MRRGKESTQRDVSTADSSLRLRPLLLTIYNRQVLLQLLIMLSFLESIILPNFTDLYIPRLNMTRKSLRSLPSLFLPLLSTYSDPTAAQLSVQTTPSLNVTAIASNDGASAIECWQIPGFKASADKGTIGSLSLFLGETANATYTVLPPRFDGGIHNAPVNQ